jgi:hypothetical protein
MIITLLVAGCGSETKANGKKENISSTKVEQPLIPKTKNEKLRPPSIPNL